MITSNRILKEYDAEIVANKINLITVVGKVDCPSTNYSYNNIHGQLVSIVYTPYTKHCIVMHSGNNPDTDPSWIREYPTDILRYIV